MPQPLLNEFPVSRLAFTQVGANQLRRVRMAQLMGMELNTRLLGVVVKHTLHRRRCERHSTGVLPRSIPGVWLQHDPQMIGARGNVNPDFRQVEIQEPQKLWRQMDEPISPISCLGAGSVLVIGAKSDMDAELAKIEVREMHSEQFTEPKSALFEHQADQPVAKAAWISLWGTSSADGVQKELEVLLRNGGRPAYWLLHPYLHPLRVQAAPGVSQQIPFNGPFPPGTSNIHHGRLGKKPTPD